MSGIGFTFLRRGGQAHPTAGNAYIKFADEVVFNILMANGVSSDGIGITRDDAARVTSIPSAWFKGNTDVTSFNEINYFYNLTRIESGAFNNCSNLYIGEINLPNLVYIGSGAFRNTHIRRLLSVGSITVFSAAGGGLGTVFQNNDTLEYVDSSILEKITTLNGAFNGCNNIVIDMLRLPATASTYVSGFDNCHIDKIVDFGEMQNFFADGALSPSSYPFGQEYRIIILPPSLTRIGRYAFHGDTAAQAIVFRSSTPPALANYALTRSESTCPVYVPDDAVAVYQSAAGFTNWSSRFKGISSLATDNPSLYAEVKDYL